MATENSPELPEDVIVADILPRLPVKSIGRFRCVSKPWRSILSSPKFAKSHLNFQTHDRPQYTIFNNEKYIYILNLDTQTCTCTCISRKEEVTSSCNGLLLLSQWDGSLIQRVLLNPTTRESLKIPDLRSAFPGYFCLGYDSLNDDYKIVSLSLEITTSDYLVDIYSVRMKTWKRVSGCPHKNCNLRLQGPGVFLNGCINWLVADPDFTIAALSLGTEEFSKLPPPRLDSLVIFRSATLEVLGGCLTLVLDVQDESTEVWTLKEYGVQDSWTKLTISHPRFRALNLVCLFGDDEVLGVNNNNQLVAYSFSNGVCRDVVVRSFSGSHFRNLTPFSESLVSPDWK